MKAFIRKYLTRSIIILLIFLFMNVLLLGLAFTIILHHTKDTNEDIEYVAEHMIPQEETQDIFSENAKEYMKNKHIWAMVLNEQGSLLASYQLPDKLNKNYTISEVAQFSRWYLDEYPVLVQVVGDGLLVIGYDSEDMLGITITKLYYVTDSGFITSSIIAVILMLIGNVVALIYLFWKNSRQVEHQVEKEFQKKDEARAQWINGVTHDIRTPLSIIMGYAAQMEDSSTLNSESKKQAKLMRKQGERMRDLIVDLNLVSRLEYSMQPIRLESLNPAELVRDTIIEFLENNEGPFEIEPDIPEVCSIEFQGDKALLKRMIINLLNNSIIHNNEGVKIIVSLRQLEAGFQIEVEDDGVGMNDQMLLELNQTVVQPTDYEIYSENGDSAHGVGLRLVIDTVKAHNGTVSFENTAPHGLVVKMIFRAFCLSPLF